jgi:hypothetical protein
MMTGKILDRAVRKRVLMLVFEKKYSDGLWIELTSWQVARAMMLEPSGFVRDLLGELVRDGLLSARKIQNERAMNLKGDNGFTVYYKLSDRRVNEIEKLARQISVNSAGKAIGQLKLF